MTPKVCKILADMYRVFNALDDWTANSIYESIETYAKEKGIPLRDAIQPIRLAISGKLVSPPIGESLEFLGQESTTNRLQTLILFMLDGISNDIADIKKALQ